MKERQSQRAPGQGSSEKRRGIISLDPLPMGTKHPLPLTLTSAVVSLRGEWETLAVLAWNVVKPKTNAAQPIGTRQGTLDVYVEQLRPDRFLLGNPPLKPGEEETILGDPTLKPEGGDSQQKSILKPSRRDN